MEKEIVCVYHKDCVDGTTAGAVVLKKFPHAQLFPLSHGHTHEEVARIMEATDSDAHLYIVDSVLGLEEFAKYYEEITIIDHHISVFEETSVFASIHPHITYIFDNDKSGASLTWSYLFPNIETPEMVQHVADDDIKTHIFGLETDYVVHYLSPLRNDPEKVCKLIGSDIALIKKEGAYITNYIQTEIKRSTERQPIILLIGAYGVPFFNITDHQSACGNILSEQLGTVVGMYTIDGNLVKCSLRSKEEQIPSALDIATVLGGGGHKNASGARMTLADFVQMLTSNT
jgi:oligoribonuclease NrnB/cAMP/cGMP phosphodiesterase (DHH superfamily)